MSITFSTCFYIIKSKFDASIYIQWMKNFLSIINNFNLVIYTDENTFPHIPKINNSRIIIIIRPLNEFYNYKYKENWIKNHEKNHLLNNRILWEVNMLWSEKIWFVNETIQKKYFDTEFYGWCDIGYFRNGNYDLHTSQLSNWANSEKINLLSINKIYYACVNNNSSYMNDLFKLINNKNEFGLPTVPIPEDQMSVAGGFFILHNSLIDWWSKTFDTKLKLYFKNDYLVKDDQVIIIDCIFSNMSFFHLFKERIPGLDNWFMFQRILN
jgi:hypothetical protein